MPGLSSALCISMLKGLLLNYSSRLDDATEITRRVKKQLAPMFGDDLPLTLLYGILDRQTGAFHFDRLGDAPLPSRVRRGEASVLSPTPTTLEREDVLVVHTEGLLASGSSVPDALTESAQAEGQDLTTLLEALTKRADRAERPELDHPQSWTVAAISRLSEAGR
jgi:hypothetical protein